MDNASWSVHVVHPYTYKFDEQTNVIGPIERFSKRDQGVHELLETALEAERPIVHHWHKPQGTLEGALGTVGLILDPNFEILFDNRVINVTTTPYGIPLADERPEKVAVDNWRELVKFYDTFLSMRSKLPKTEKVLFLGGVYENCLVNCICHFNDHFRHQTQRLYVCPELSVSLNSKEYTRCRGILLSRGVGEMTAEEAIDATSRKMIESVA